MKKLRVQVISLSKCVHCQSISLLAVTKLTKEPVTAHQYGVQPYQNMMSSAWAQTQESKGFKIC